MVCYDDIFAGIRVRNRHSFGFIEMIVRFLGRESQIVFLFSDFIEICRFRVFVGCCYVIVNANR